MRTMARFNSGLSVLLVACCFVGACHAAQPLNRVPKTFNISLDAPPQERWAEAAVAIVEEFVRDAGAV